MSKKQPLSPQVVDSIHFDTLLDQAQQVIADQSRQRWTDTAEHDPGITLLQALAYATSDVAYRHVLPLEDLLTPPESEKQEGLFPKAFGPHQALTCSPITEDDYRRALLDLHSEDDRADEPAWKGPDKLNPLNVANGEFGGAVSLSGDGNTLAVGACGADSTVREVYVYRRLSGRWVALPPLTGDTPGQYFGRALSLSRDGLTLAVGAPATLTAAGTSGTTGAIYVFGYHNGAWSRQQVFTTNVTDDGFGFSVCLDSAGATMVVGAPFADEGKTNSGTGYVYYREASGWSAARIVEWVRGNDVEFGYSVSLSGDGHTLAVGARCKWVGSADRAGDVYLFDRSGQGWLPPRRMNTGDAAKGNEQFGFAVSLDYAGRTLVIGAPRTDADGRNSGSAYVYQRHDLDWSQQVLTRSAPAAGDEFGHAVSLSGDGQTLLVGAWCKKVGTQSNAGMAYAFERLGQDWSTRDSLIGAAGSSSGAYFGTALSLDDNGKTLVVGAHAETPAGLANRAGAAYLFSSEDRNTFYFRNAQLVRESDQEQFRYWYDPEVKEFRFRKGPDTDVELTLSGGYHLFVEPSRGVTRKAAESALEAFLRKHRNLCEAVRHITWLTAQTVNITLSVELDDDCQNPAAVLAQIFTVAEALISPAAARYTAVELAAQGLANDAIYQGPRLHHGWIPQLPPAPDYRRDSAFNIGLLANHLMAIEGVRTIGAMGVEGSTGWDCLVRAGSFPLLWGDDPLAQLAAGHHVRLFKQGQQLRPSAEEIHVHLPSPPLIDEQGRTLPYGRWRKPAVYRSAGSRLPPCYGLQEAAVRHEQLQLQRFLLPFEQQLANACQQLALLPALLGFDRTAQPVDAPVWGGQWPFADDALAQPVHQPYRQALEQETGVQSRSRAQELALIDYLLGYFGAQRAPQTLGVAAAEFLAVQRAYLQQQTTLTYDRVNVNIKEVSALQRRIAARLGLRLFQAQDLEKLPFYLIEHRALLPQPPAEGADSAYTPSALAKDSEDAPRWLLITVKPADPQPERGQVIDLLLEESDAAISTLVIGKVDENRLWLEIPGQLRLERNLPRIVAAQEAGTLRWRYSAVWLKEMRYRLEYAEDQEFMEPAQRRVQSSPYPVRLAVGDNIVLEPDYAGARTPAAGRDEQARARVRSVDPVNGCFVAELQSGAWPDPGARSRYRFTLDKSIDDRFSFALSLVFNRNLLANVAAADIPSASAWIWQVVQEEIPCHLVANLHWLGPAEFNDLAETYGLWQNQGAPLGDLSYRLLYQLSLGDASFAVSGINVMRIATDAQRTEVIGADGDGWDTEKIAEYELFFVPPDA